MLGGRNTVSWVSVICLAVGALGASTLISQPVDAQTGRQMPMTGSTVTLCNLGATTFALQMTVSKNSITGLTFAGSAPGSVSGASKTATTSMNYTLKCNSSTKSLTLVVNPATNSTGKYQDYSVTIMRGSVVVASAKSTGSSADFVQFTPGLTIGSSYTVVVASVTPKDAANSGTYSAQFTIQ